MESGYIKSNLTKHIAPKLFYPHELQKNGEIVILQTKSCDNLTDLFTKSLPYSLFHKYVEGIGMRRFRDLQKTGGVHMKNYFFVHRIVLFSLYEFYFDGFSYEVFNESISTLCMLYHLIFSTTLCMLYQVIFLHRGLLGDDILRTYT
jgi:hypothetical protein